MPVDIDKLSRDRIREISRDSSSHYPSIYEYSTFPLHLQGVNGMIQTDTTHIKFEYRDDFRSHERIITYEGKGAKAQQYDHYKELEP